MGPTWNPYAVAKQTYFLETINQTKKIKREKNVSRTRNKKATELQDIGGKLKKYWLQQRAKLPLSFWHQFSLADQAYLH